MPQGSQDTTPNAGPHQTSLGRWLAETAVLVVLAVVLAVGIKTFVVQPFMIPSASMEPTLMIGDRVLVNRFIYRFQPPRAGDIVVFVSQQEGGLDLIKRVIAVGGQTVELREGTVYVDGKAIEEPYVNQAIRDTYTSNSMTKVPPGYLWVMGDNRTNSRDSRYLGPQAVSSVVGKAFCIYWPIPRIRVLR